MRFSDVSARRAIGAALVLVCAGVADRAAAQDLVGQVRLGERGAAEVEVELHRVTRDSAGVVGRTRTAGGGAFRMPVPAADTTGFTVFFATASYQGVRYFGPPLHPGEARDGYEIAVFDTIPADRAEVPIHVQRRDVILLPDRQGGWEVNELLQIANRGSYTLMPQEGKATWELPIPAHATSFEVGDTEVSVDDVVRVGDRALLVHPLVPGVREMFIRYRLGADAPSELILRLGAATDTLNLMIGQPSPRITVDGLERGSAFEAQGQTFAAYQGAGLSASDVVTLSWRPVGPPVNPTVAALAILGVFLVAGGFAALRRRERTDAGGALPPPERLPVGAVVRDDPARVREPVS
jgi:hypothetical protein